MAHLRFRQVHLDFHTSEKIVSIGKDFDAEEFAKTLKEAYVNSVTCFARCHHGMIYYDTKFKEARHPGLEFDLLRAQIEACHRVGIKVPIYITVGWDEFVSRRHPEWCNLDPEGRFVGPGAKPLSPGWRRLCLNTPYVDYVFEQTKEVLELFDVDGLFFDIIHQPPCLCHYCLQGMLEEGLDPENPNDRVRYARKVQTQFQREMTSMVRKYNKECTIFYNAGHISPQTAELIDTYSHLELESLPSGGWGYEHFPLTVRYARNLGLDYLGMTGKFHKSWADFGAFKNEAALQYECFIALANGAKCSIGDQLHPSGKLDPVTYQLIGSVYKEVAKREPWCDNVSAVTEIGVFTPEALGKAEGRVDPAMAGVYRMLREAHYQFDVLDARSDFSQYQVIILPDKITCDDLLREKVAQYVAGGGRLILSYHSGLDPELSRFVVDVGADYLGDAPYCPDYVKVTPELSAGIPDTEYVMYDRGLALGLTSGQPLAEIWQPYFNRSYLHFCSHRQTPVEKPSGYPAVVRNNNVIYFAHPIFTMYKAHGVRVYKQMVLNALRLLYPEQLVTADGPTTLEITLNRQPRENRYVAHLLHYIPERRSSSVDTIEDVIPLYDLNLSVRIPQCPSKVYLAPTQEELAFQYDNGRVKLTVPKLEGHAMVVFEG